jgi:hypothetical protein
VLPGSPGLLEGVPVPAVVDDALGGRPVVRSLVVNASSELAVALAAAGEGVCWDEDEELLFPGEYDSSTTPEEGRRTVSAMLWANENPRPASPCAGIVAAAASGDRAAQAVLYAWAPDPYSRPNLGVRNMNHDRELCELVWEQALREPPTLEGLLLVLTSHAYYPAGRRPELAGLAARAGVDLTYFVAQAERDATERMRWFGAREPLS